MTATLVDHLTYIDWTADSVLIETGACQYCKGLGIACEADQKSRKRPFYRVSGEVYEYSIKLLRRFVPEEKLPELTVESIQALLRGLDAGKDDASPTPSSGTATVALLPGGNHVSLADVDPTGNSDVMEAAEHPLLQEELGCLLLDSMGKYRSFLSCQPSVFTWTMTD